jgi:hypothetical protein
MILLSTPRHPLAFGAAGLHRIPYKAGSAVPTGQISDQRETPNQPPENVSTPHSISIHFKGIFQCRLATTPDPSDHPKGQDGFTFVHEGEPDFDRIIRFNNPVASRACAEKAEVLVTRVILDGSEVADTLIGKQVNLGPNSFFDASSSGPGNEPIANFEFHIGTGNRYVSGESTTPPKGQGLNELDPATLSALGVDTEQNFRRWVRKRLKCLETLSSSIAAASAAAYQAAAAAAAAGAPGFAAAANSFAAAGAIAQSNIDQRIDKILSHMPESGSFRWQVLRLFASYPGTIDKNLQLNPMDSPAVQAMVDGGVTALDFEAKFSSFDADGLVGRVEGLVKAAWTT